MYVTCNTILGVIIYTDICFQLVLFGWKNISLLQAYFLRTIHTDPGKIKTLFIITNTWHMDRTTAIFNHVFGLPLQRSHQSLFPFFRQSTTLSSPSSHGYTLQFRPVQEGLEEPMLSVRSKREQSSLQTFLSSTRYEFQSMEEMHAWLFHKHNAYATSRFLDNANQDLNPDVLKTY